MKSARSRQGAAKAIFLSAVFLVLGAVVAWAQLDRRGDHAPRSKTNLPPKSAVFRAKAEKKVPLPADFPRWGYKSYRPVGKGMFMVSVTSKGKPWLIVFDSHGIPRWWQEPKLSALQASILPNGTATWSRAFHDGYGVNPRMAQEVHTLSGRLIGLLKTQGDTITDGHEVQPAPGGGVFLVSYVPRHGVDLSAYRGPRNTSVVDAEVQQVTSTGRLLWRWSSIGHISFTETERWWHNNVLSNMHVVQGQETYDPVHINSVEPWGKDQVIISTRHTDAVFGIDKASGEVIWKLGGTHTEDSLRVLGDDPYAGKLFGGQHDARIHPGNVLSIYDDGTHRGRPPRAVFYRLDLEKGTATFIRQLTDPLITHSHCCGSVRPFAGGSIVDWGNNPLLTAYNAKGQKTFRLRMPSHSYRAVPVPAGITAARLRHAMAHAGS